MQCKRILPMPRCRNRSAFQAQLEGEIRYHPIWNVRLPVGRFAIRRPVGSATRANLAGFTWTLSSSSCPSWSCAVGKSTQARSLAPTPGLPR
jgi:hypothetical protein